MNGDGFIEGLDGEEFEQYDEQFEEMVRQAEAQHIKGLSHRSFGILN